MKARLYVLPGSHPSMSGRLMLEYKEIDYRRTDLIAVISKIVLRAAGFPSVTVPALKIDGERIQGTQAISAALDRIVPEPPLHPTDPAMRTKVDEAESWGNDVLQPIPRRLIWNLLSRDSKPGRSYLEGAKLGMPIGLAARTAPPIIALAKRFNEAGDDQVRADLQALPAALDRVDALLAEGVIGGDAPNAADFQIAPAIRLLATLDDVRHLLEDRPCLPYALGLVPDFPGYTPKLLPDGWVPA